MKTNFNFIFDFDGTLVDSFHTAISKFNLLASELNFKYINDTEIHAIKNLTSKELIKYLNIPLYKIPGVLIKARALMSSEMKNLPSFVNLPEVIRQIYDMNINLGILTSNSSENVHAWLKYHEMEKYFHFVHIESNYFGKKRILKKIIKRYKFNQSKTFYIGDETRDIEAANACAIHSVAVTWGFNSEEILKRYQPHFIAREPKDIIAMLASLMAG